MAISFVAAGSIASLPTAGGASTVPVPAGVQNGDALICVGFSANNSNGTGVQAPAGWSLITQIAPGAFNAGVALYGRVASSEPANYSFTQPTTSSNGAAMILAWRGAHASAPFGASSTTPVVGGGTTNCALPTLTTTNADAWAVGVGFEWNGNTPTITANAPMTQRGQSTASGRSFCVADELISAAGAVSGRAQTGSVAGDYAGIMVELVPAAVPASLSGGVTLDAAVAAGSLASSPSDLSGGITLDPVAPAGLLGMQPGTIVTDSFRAPVTGSTLVSTTIPKVAILRVSDMVNVLTLTNQTTNGSGVLTITNTALLQGVRYLLVACNADGTAFGAESYTST